MKYHSDDEIGVQGTIAALSLGSPATMTFRLKPEKKTKEDGDEGVNEDADESKNKPPLNPPPCLGFRMLHVSSILRCSSMPFSKRTSFHRRVIFSSWTESAYSRTTRYAE
jgi:hypothetical protein